MGEMTSPSITCPAVLSTNEVPSGVGLQNDIVTKHDFATCDTGCNVEPLKRKPVEFSCTQNTNASLANLETTSNVPTNQNTSFTENDRNTSNTFSSASQTQNGVEHMNTSQPVHANSCETKVLKQSLVPGSFVQIYHISEDGSTGYFETVQVVSSMGNDVIKVDTPLTSKSKGDGLGDRQSDSVVVDHDANKVTSYSVLRQHDCPVTGTEGSLSSTATGTCSSQHQVAGRIILHGSYRIQPIKHTCPNSHTAPFLITRIHNYCKCGTTEKWCHLVLNSWHHFSVVLH